MIGLPWDRLVENQRVITLDQLNETLQQHAPGVWRCLSPVGRGAIYPPDIPFQAAQARDTRYNGTIGQITDGAGHILALPVMKESLSSLGEAERNQALLYSPIAGLPELRERWHEYQRKDLPAETPASGLPIVTIGLTHGLALSADLFGGPGRKVIVPTPFWGNYRQIFELRTGAELIEVEAYEKIGQQRRWRPEALAEAMAGLGEGEPVVAILNLPSNPGGYSPTDEERTVLLESLVEQAAHRSIVVVCDDAYAGLVYDEAIEKRSVFFDLLGKHDDLIPVRLAGSTKEFTFFGGRVGFMTLPFAQDSPVGRALDNKARCLLRAGVGSPVATSQVLLLRALRDATIDQQIGESLGRLRRRFDTVSEALADVDPELLRAMPSNSGVFTLLELPPALDPEVVRQHLIQEHDTGVVSIGPCYLRIAFCSVDEKDLPELVRRVAQGVRELL